MFAGRYEVLSYKGGRIRKPLKVPERRKPEDWPECPDPGQAWRTGKYFCIPMTVGHIINNDLGQVNPLTDHLTKSGCCS